MSISEAEGRNIEAKKLLNAAKQALEALNTVARELGVDWLRPEFETAEEARTTLRTALDQQPADEPVPICPNCLGTKRPHADDPEWKGRCDCTRPQPAAQWVGLTDEEIVRVLGSVRELLTGNTFGAFARAIEAKLKEKNT